MKPPANVHGSLRRCAWCGSRKRRVIWIGPRKSSRPGRVSRGAVVHCHNVGCSRFRFPDLRWLPGEARRG